MGGSCKNKLSFGEFDVVVVDNEDGDEGGSDTCAASFGKHSKKLTGIELSPGSERGTEAPLAGWIEFSLETN